LVTGKTRMRGRPQFGYLFHRITIPMRDADEIIGALNLYSREPRE